MTAAIFGLVGVVVGGVVTVASELLREWRSVRTETRAGARLLSAELSVQQFILEARAEDDRTAPVDDDTPAITAWPEYRAVMARVLDQKAWQAVAGAYFKLLLWHFDVGATSSGSAQERADQMRALASEVEVARGHLQHLSGVRGGSRRSLVHR